MEKADENGPNPFVVKILTPNSCALKILQTPYCEPRAQQALQKVGGEGGTPKREQVAQMVMPLSGSARKFFLGRNPQVHIVCSHMSLDFYSRTF